MGANAGLVLPELVREPEVAVEVLGRGAVEVVAGDLTIPASLRAARPCAVPARFATSEMSRPATTS